MNTRIKKMALAGAIALTGLGFGIAGASAVPINGLSPAVATQADIGAQVENVRVVRGGPRGGPRGGFRGGYRGGPRGGYRGRRGGRYFRGGRWFYYGGCSLPAYIAGLCM